MYLLFHNMFYYVCLDKNPLMYTVRNKCLMYGYPPGISDPHIFGLMKTLFFADALRTTWVFLGKHESRQSLLMHTQRLLSLMYGHIAPTKHEPSPGQLFYHLCQPRFDKR